MAELKRYKEDESIWAAQQRKSNRRMEQEGRTMTLTKMFTICDSCVYAPCLCGNDPENCVAYVMRTSDNG